MAWRRRPHSVRSLRNYKELDYKQHCSTETFDGMGSVEEDPRYKIHAKFHDYLLDAFPLVYALHHISFEGTDCS